MSTKKDNTNTAVSTQKQFTQEDIPGMIENIDKQITAIKKGLAAEDRTTGHLSGFGKIKEIKSVELLLKAYSSVAEKEAAYDRAANEILPAGIKKPPFKLDGHAAEAWKEDIEGRVILVARKTELEKLAKAKAILEENLSAKAKLAKSLADISSMFTTDDDND